MFIINKNINIKALYLDIVPVLKWLQWCKLVLLYWDIFTNIRSFLLFVDQDKAINALKNIIECI